METAIGDEAELDLLGAEPCAAGEDGPFAQDEAGQVGIIGRVVRDAHRWAGGKDAPSIDVLMAVAPHTDLAELLQQNAATREYLAARADFLGAIRLPYDDFKREGTAVVTDIIFMRKRSLDKPPNHADPEWLGVAPSTIEDVDVAINRYFVRHHEMVLGTWTRKDTLQGGEGYSVIGNGDLAAKLKAAIQRLPQFAPSTASPVLEQPTPAFTPPPPERHITEGSFFIDDDRIICQCVERQTVRVVYGGPTLRAGGLSTRNVNGSSGRSPGGTIFALCYLPHVDNICRRERVGTYLGRLFDAYRDTNVDDRVIPQRTATVRPAGRQPRSGYSTTHSAPTGRGRPAARANASE